MEKIKRGKKGVSALIATVLLVLITVAGIGIIWNFVRPMLTPDDSTLACMDAELTISTDEGYTYMDNVVTNDTVNIQILAGSKAVLEDMMIRIVTDKKNMVTKTVSAGNGISPTTKLGPNEGNVYTINITKVGASGNVTSASVAAILKSKTTGKDIICPMGNAKNIPLFSDF